MVKSFIGIALALAGALTALVLAFVYFLFSELPERDALLLPTIISAVGGAVGLWLFSVGSRESTHHVIEDAGVEVFETSND